MKTMKNLRMSLEPLQMSKTTVPGLPLHQGPAASSQGPVASSHGPAASANFGDEDSEYSDEYSAKSQDSGRTVLCSDLYVLTNHEHWTMTTETHKYASAVRSFLWQQKIENDKTIQFDYYAVSTTIIVPQWDDQ